MKSSFAIAHAVRMKNRKAAGGAVDCKNCLSKGGLCMAHGGEVASEEDGMEGYDQDLLSNEDSDAAEMEAEGSDMDSPLDEENDQTKMKSRLARILASRRS